ncbi:MAG: hypothetical protein JWP89_3455 [Schlesneria sp.]|nr:hypothetical protein [Schlesneria sp.]
MADQWFYRVFGQVVGPMPLQQLRELADSGTIRALDDVRSDSSDWVAAATVDELGLSTSERRTNSNMATMTMSDLEIATSTGNDDWYYEMGGQELGPITFDELLTFSEQEQISADDQVKLGAQGKWRRAGSIGRLMAALPYKPVEKTIAPTPASRPLDRQPPVIVVAPQALPEPDLEATYRAAYEDAKAKVAQTILAQAEATYQAAEQQAQALLTWSAKPEVDRNWWGWSNGVEFGPVEFSQVFGLAKAGQLKATDFVRNGQFGQYVPASNLPGLFNAVAMLMQAKQQRDLAASQAQAAAAAAAPPVIPVLAMKPVQISEPVRVVKETAPQPAAPRRQSDAVTAVTASPPKPRSNPEIDTVPASNRAASKPSINTPAAEAPISPEPARATPARPMGYSSPMASTSGFGSSSSSSYAASRPAPVAKSYPKKSSASDSTWFSDIMDTLKQPKVLGAAVAVLLVVGWFVMPASRGADIKRYQALKQILDEIQTKRSNPGELTSLQEKLGTTAKKILAEVKDKAGRDEPVKQSLLWATRDEVPRMIQAGFTVESPAEISFAARLKEAAYNLGLEKRPEIQMAQTVNSD